MPVTKEQWEQIERTLRSPFDGYVSLICDGYKIDAQVQQHKMKLMVAVYVDGKIMGAWIFNEAKSEIPVKFHREVKRPAGGAKHRAWCLAQAKSKIWSKEERARFAAEAKETTSYYESHWTNPKAFCLHIRKTCQSIEVVRIGY